MTTTEFANLCSENGAIWFFLGSFAFLLLSSALTATLVTGKRKENKSFKIILLLIIVSLIGIVLTFYTAIHLSNESDQCIEKELPTYFASLPTQKASLVSIADDSNGKTIIVSINGQTVDLSPYTNELEPARTFTTVYDGTGMGFVTYKEIDNLFSLGFEPGAYDVVIHLPKSE